MAVLTLEAGRIIVIAAPIIARLLSRLVIVLVWCRVRACRLLGMAPACVRALRVANSVLVILAGRQVHRLATLLWLGATLMC